MRVYFEKPRTTVGWKGLINDPVPRRQLPHQRGPAHRARPAGATSTELGVPAGCEFLDVISPQYIGDLVVLGRDRRAHHREPGAPRAGLGPVGAGRLQERHRRQRARSPSTRCSPRAQPHHFLSVHKSGQVGDRRRRAATTTATSSCAAARRRTTTRPASPRPARSSPRPKLPQRADDRLLATPTPPSSTSGQVDVGARHRRAARRRRAAHRRRDGRVAPGRGPPGARARQAAAFGQSVTDACLGWERSDRLLEALAEAVRRGAQAAAIQTHGPTPA